MYLWNKIVEYNKSELIICNYLKNGESEKVIPILPMVFDIIKEHKRHSNGIIFSHSDKHLKRSRVAKLWERYLKANKLNINMHQLRHTYATLLHKAGVDLKTAMELMGHKNMAMLLKIYTHTDVETLQASVLHMFMERKYDIT